MDELKIGSKILNFQFSHLDVILILQATLIFAYEVGFEKSTFFLKKIKFKVLVVCDLLKKQVNSFIE